jgi:group I intron endonuclease
MDSLDFLKQNKQFCSIYVIKNTINGKMYIGQTWQSLSKRFSEHKSVSSECVKLKNTIEKYGNDNFSIDLIGIAYNQEDANLLEDFFITNCNSIKNGYNIKTGGSYGKHSDETKIKMSKKKIGKSFSSEHKKNISQSKLGKSNTHLIGNTIWSGRTHSVETRKKLSEMMVGNKLSDEVKRKIAISCKGKIVSEESKQKMRRFSKEIEKNIHEEYNKKNVTMKWLANKYDCSITTIFNAIRRIENE